MIKLSKAVLKCGVSRKEVVAGPNQICYDRKGGREEKEQGLASSFINTCIYPMSGIRPGRVSIISYEYYSKWFITPPLPLVCCSA